jgi:YihY family inner membrane protein
VNQLQQWVRRLDGLQQRHIWLGLPIAVFKKYADDRGNDKVALITYYAFLSLFPLLLLLLTALELLISGQPELRRTILESTLDNFPILSKELSQNIETLNGTWFRIIISSLITLLASFGIASALRSMINDFWYVPRLKRRGFPLNHLVDLGIVLVGALILIATTLVAGWLTRQGSPWYYALSLAINFGLFLLVYRLATVRVVTTKHLLIQAGLTALAWQILQGLGSYLIERQLGSLGALYGSFAIVLGLLFWLYLVARVAAYAIEIDVVLTKKLWPRSISGRLTEADKKVLASLVDTEKRDRNQNIRTTIAEKEK